MFSAFDFSLDSKFSLRSACFGMKFEFRVKNCAFCAVISQGINAGDVKKLQDAGIYTCNGLMMHTKKVYTTIFSSNPLNRECFGPIFKISTSSELDGDQRFIGG